MKDSKVWGPHVWYFMHKVAFDLPRGNINHSNKEKLKNFYQTIRILLPCSSCKQHYSLMLKRMPPVKNTGLELANWTVHIHNLTNQGLRKNLHRYKEAQRFYKGINHNKLQLFFYYLIMKNNDSPLHVRKSMVHQMIDLYPCKKCSARFKEYKKDMTNFNKWCEDFYEFMKIKCE
jgi:hypothetical protein